MSKTARFDYTQCKQKGIVDPKILVGGVVVVAVVAFLVVTGNFKFSASINNQQAPTPSEAQDQPQEESSAPQTKSYTNGTYGISLEYPEGWSVKESPAADVVVAFGSPKEGSDDKFVDNVNVTYTDLSSKGNLTLEQLTNSWLKEAENFPAFKLVDKVSTSMAGEAAEQLVYSFSNKGIDVQGRVVITAKNKKVYIVTYTAEATSYDKFVDAADTISTSLQIK